MAPRRSTARASSATPVRGATPAKRPTRASSALEPEDAIPRRSTRGASQQPSIANGDVNNPRLPEVQIQQSYTYGSSKAPVLPTQLIARSRMNLLQMAETIDAGVDQAEQHLQHHMEETRANLQKDAREERARRRASRERSQDGSVASDEPEQSRSQRVAAWASSVDDPPQLNGIAEEEQEDEQVEEQEDASPARSTLDDASDKGTDPSSFPSGMFDHSYNYERGLRKPNITIRQPQEPFLGKISRALRERAQRGRHASSQFASSTWSWLQRLLAAVGESIRNLPNSPLISTMTTLLFTLLLIGAASHSFCYMYNNYVCDPLAVSLPGQMLQRYCGTCARTPGRAPLNFTLGGGDDLSKLSVAINSINHQLRDLETRINDKVDSKHAAVDKGIDALKKQHSELSSHVANLKLGGRANTLSGDVASPVIPKINYLAPNNGAMVEPRLTSPTMQRPLAFIQRVLLRVFLSAGYVSKPPITALSPWQDVGDCWCASSAPGADAEHDQADTMRLGVTVTEMIYPTEVVVENYPSGGSLLPGSTPKVIELWADFGHLDSREWKSLSIRQMQSEGGSPIGPTYALVGRMEYDASGEASHVQAFPLDVNQDSLAYAAQNFVVRVTENYGAEYTCLYRVRLHGVPVFEHSSEGALAA
ncbi:hypothetical protein CLCR_05621 [Cladophialophora carrionii]|uniref:SUN domain-containing protein n=1 Tax=Cladophialophora carrionii TaxID=86049 RepID=A0A1C1C7N2_9EURO|nr:hypothetical protein CLCR_05621 [Cladophialophora carrionii]